MSEKATLIINLSRKQINRGIKTMCEQTKEPICKITDGLWDELTKEPVKLTVEDFLNMDLPLTSEIISLIIATAINKVGERIDVEDEELLEKEEIPTELKDIADKIIGSLYNLKDALSEFKAAVKK